MILSLSCGLVSQQPGIAPSDEKYQILDDVRISTRDGATISAIVVEKKGSTARLPVILQFTIYVRDRDINSLKEAADAGYVGVIAYTRGKRNSPDEIYPYERDGQDAYDVIDWISRQSWCNGQVGMYGGSYNGFTQWAAAKKLHPALKTIVPYVANRPGMGLPMENNVFINPNYEWAFYVGNNKSLDDVVGNDPQRFRKMQNEWWRTGAAYSTLDSIDGTPNRWFQRWIRHPSFDQYWQDMAPYGKEFANIKIPVLTIDGYYNDSQNSSLYYLREHYKYIPNAEHYLIIGPYSHFGAQREGEAILNGYTVDPHALINTKQITYQWFDYILRNGPKPPMLKDKINYQVMGADEWRSAPSIDKMSNGSMTFYLANNNTGNPHLLSAKKPAKKGFLQQDVDFKDRIIVNNFEYYPSPIIQKEVDMTDGFVFLSEPLNESLLVNGAFLGNIKASINKRDFDFGITLYEVMPDGQYFHLSYTIGRASYAWDITKRRLLTPNKIESIPFSNTHLVSKQLQKGSRLVVKITVNKNPFSQLNYGTGKDVSDETIDDATEPLWVKWFNDSYIKIPIWKGN